MGLFEGSEPQGGEEPVPSPPAPIKRGVRITLKGEDKRTITSGTTAEFPLVIEPLHDGFFRVKVDLDSTSEQGEAPEWVVKLSGLENKVWDLTFTGITELKGGQSKGVTLSVQAPRGARYGDKLTVTVHVTDRDDPGVTDSLMATATTKQAVIAVKTSIGHEKTVADAIASRVKGQDSGTFSILAPGNLRGYVFVESMNPDRLSEVVKGIRRARGIIRGETSLEDVAHYLTPKPVVSGIVEGDIVELVAGPFKGEKARVQHIDEGKEEITVELFEAMVPIPVTVRGDHVRVIEKEEK
jgi:transcriptional antiterminator NusG